MFFLIFVSKKKKKMRTLLSPAEPFLLVFAVAKTRQIELPASSQKTMILFN